MRCPKCQEGEINEIFFKIDSRMANFCDFCETLWFENEVIRADTGHALESFKEVESPEYFISEFYKKDQDHRPINDVRQI